ncbi:MAG: ROK family protein [Lentisphaeria bacterium]|nr:ROK family protein [Lentisphaeria bacterium]
MPEEIVLGYDVGGTKLGIGLVTADGKILGQARIENKDTYPEDVLPQLVTIAGKLVAEAGLTMKDVSGFGISAPGVADVAKGILTAPVNNKYWRNVPIQQYLQDNLGLPGCFENDANCGALAEGYFGAGRGVDDFIYLTMSTGVGAGIVTGGTLVRGVGLYGGEAGHIVIEANSGRKCSCGLSGCYEAYCGGRSIALYLQEKLKDQPGHKIVECAGGNVNDIDMVALEKAYRAGDALAQEIWAEMSLRNAQAMGLMINMLNPKRIILGTLAWAIGDIYTDPIKELLPRFAWKEMLADFELVNSELRRDIGTYAGAAAALYFLLKKPFKVS